MSDHHRQNVIEVDGNCSIDTIAEKLLLKLDTYSSRRAVVPQQLREIEEEETRQIDEDPVRNALIFLI